MLSWIHSLLPSQVQYTNIFHLRQQCDFITMNLEKDDVEWNWKVWKQSLWSASLGNYFSSSIFWINRNPIENNIRDRGSTALYTAYTDDTFYTVNIVQTALHWLYSSNSLHCLNSSMYILYIHTYVCLYIYQGGRTWQPFVGGKNPGP